MARVYVSATYSDLQECRAQVRLMLKRLGHDDVAMEYYVAEDRRPLERCLADVRSCELYLGIFAYRYGYVPKGYNQSITELEYRAAAGKPRIILLHDKSAPWPPDRIEIDAYTKIEALRKELEDEHLVAYFRSKDDIEARVAEAILQWGRSAGETTAARFETWLASYTRSLEADFARHLRTGDSDAAASAARYMDILVVPQASGRRPSRAAADSDPGTDTPDAARVRSSPPRPLSEVLASSPRLILRGEGGAGKTTLLMKLAVDGLHEARTNPRAPLPLFFKLNFFDAREKYFESLLELIGRSVGLAVDELRQLWDTGSRPIRLVLDGYNEVPPAFLGHCGLALQQLTSRSTDEYIISSRPGPAADDLAGQLNDVLVADVVKLNPHQIKRYLAAYGLATLYDRMGDGLKRLSENPFLLWAIAETCLGLGPERLPSNVGKLYEALFDYIYDVREQTKPPEVRPTRYNYSLVKQPVLAALAWRMRDRGATRIEENRELLSWVRERLVALRAEYDGVYPAEDHKLMPKEPAAKSFVDEVVDNGVLVRVGGTLEFMHESVLDYFTSLEMKAWDIEKVIEVVPPLLFRLVEPEHEELSLPAGLTQAVIMLAGLRSDAEVLVERLHDRHPLVSAHCLVSAGLHGSGLAARLVSEWTAWLDESPRYRWIACQCLQRGRPQRPDVALRLATIALTDSESEVRKSAARAVAATGMAEAVERVVLGLFEGEGSAAPWLVQYLTSDVAVYFLFSIWRDRATPEPRARRAEQMLASMDEDLVTSTLKLLEEASRELGDAATGDAVRMALARLPDWEGFGLGLTIRRAARRGVARRREALQAKASEMASWPDDRIVAVLRAEDNIAVDVALGLIRDRHIDAVAELFDVLARSHAEPQLEKCLRTLAVFGQSAAEEWRQRLLDPAWPPPLIEVPADWTKDFDRGPNEPLTERWSTLLRDHGWNTTDRAVSVAVEHGWLLGSNSAGQLYEQNYFVTTPRQSMTQVFDAGMRPRVIQAGSVLGVDALPILDRVLEMDGPFVEEATVHVLRRIGGEGVVERLVAMLRQGRLTDDCIAALSDTGSRRAIAPLMEQLERLLGERSLDTHAASSTRETSSMIAAVEKKIKTIGQAVASTADGTSALRGFVAENATADDAARRFAVVVLTTISADVTADAESLLQQLAQNGALFVRLAAIERLASYPDKATQALLTGMCLMDDEKDIRAAAATSLRQMPTSDFLERLASGLRDSEAVTRVRAAEAIALVGDQASIPALQAAWTDSASNVRIAAADALRVLGVPLPPAWIPDLVTIATSGAEPQTRGAAARLLQYFPDGKDALFAPVEAAVNEARYNEVIRLIGDGVPVLLSEDDPHPFFFRALAFEGSGRFEEALRDLERVRDLLPSFALGHSLRARVLSALGRKAEALEAAREAAGLSPEDVDLQLALGWAAYESNQLDDSISANERALVVDPACAQAGFNLSLAYLVRDGWEKAEPGYRRALELVAPLDDQAARTSLEEALDDLSTLDTLHPERAEDARQAMRLVQEGLALRQPE